MGVIGVYGVQGASTVVFYGLHNMQHRGQEGAGIVTFSEDGAAHRYRGTGLVNEVFNPGNIAPLEGTIGLGSVRYANVSKGGIDNVGPQFFHHRAGDFAIANDGNLVNSAQIADYLEKRGDIFHTLTDSEILAHLIKKERDEDRIERNRSPHAR